LKMQDRIYDCIVIGGGISGLRTATLLKEKDLDVCVLEARDRVGGRTHSVVVDGYRWDVGGQWVGPTQRRVLDLVKESGQKTFPQQQNGKKVLEIDGKCSRYSGTIPPLNIFGMIETNITLWRLERLCQTINVEAPYLSPNAAQLDSITVQQWIDRNVYSKITKKLIHIALIAVFSADPAEISLLFALFYFKSAGGVMPCLEVEKGAQQDRILGSAHQLSLTMNERLGNQVVHLEHEVQSIDHKDEVIIITCNNNKRFYARRVVVTVPPILATRIQYSPALPTPRQHLTQRMPMGQVIKFVIFYDTCFWRDLGFAGEIVSDRESICVCYDGSFEDGSRASIVGFFEGNSAREWADRPQEDRRKEVIDLLHKSFGDDRALQPTRYIDQNWMAERYSLGGYGSLCPPGVITSVGNALRQPVDKIHFAGSETGMQWAGYMEGALQSAERVSDEVVQALKGKNAKSSSKPYQYMDTKLARSNKSVTSGSSMVLLSCTLVVFVSMLVLLIK
ncbi:hypothetical protein SAMD00019534_079230, partial [Acytostelium subglobosum LB1]|uniref:hypothetical protein n=1 Tax=Acytostelium subglobosum LB1 TaxID=1410327 RepID=UPI000644E861